MDQILKNSTYLPEAGLVVQLRKALEKLGEVALGQLNVIIMCKESDARMTFVMEIANREVPERKPPWVVHFRRNDGTDEIFGSFEDEKAADEWTEMFIAQCEKEDGKFDGVCAPQELSDPKFSDPA